MRRRFQKVFSKHFWLLAGSTVALGAQRSAEIMLAIKPAWRMGAALMEAAWGKAAPRTARQKSYMQNNHRLDRPLDTAQWRGA
ncbi:hypothetical protein B0T24DRAFT_258575 [Lasiosphaeria ovina]|uniref:Beta-N-acetylhexosaminidase n=1 Tax=Lasiosphaeria ovina TaxID=92902 RepID=A0AAE0KC01_9PEZI|nr:hypothetical protein B0T24DRAFT_258575 [Lasiosphaeria ovina]